MKASPHSGEDAFGGALKKIGLGQRDQKPFTSEKVGKMINGFRLLRRVSMHTTDRDRAPGFGTGINRQPSQHFYKEPVYT